MKIPINVNADEAGKKRMEKQETTWTATKLWGVGALGLAIALALILLASQCQITPLPYLP